MLILALVGCRRSGAPFVPPDGGPGPDVVSSRCLVDADGDGALATPPTGCAALDENVPFDCDDADADPEQVALRGDDCDIYRSPNTVRITPAGTPLDLAFPDGVATPGDLMVEPFDCAPLDAGQGHVANVGGTCFRVTTEAVPNEPSVMGWRYIFAAGAFEPPACVETPPALRLSVCRADAACAPTEWRLDGQCCALGPPQTIGAAQSRVDLGVAVDLRETSAFEVRVVLELGDDDEDDVAAPFDNCPCDANGTQVDTDDDGIGDACDDSHRPWPSEDPVVYTHPTLPVTIYYPSVEATGTSSITEVACSQQASSLAENVTLNLGGTCYRVESTYYRGSEPTVVCIDHQHVLQAGELPSFCDPDGSVGQAYVQPLVCREASACEPSEEQVDGLCCGPDLGAVRTTSRVGRRLGEACVSLDSLSPAVQLGVALDTTDAFDFDGITRGDAPPDNCPCSFNPSQADADGDGIGDACDED